MEKEGITPDFAVFCDAYYIADNIKISDETYFKNMNFIADIKSEPYVFKLPSKRKIVYHPDNELIVKQIARRNNMKLNESYGTTSALALSCACKMGFEKIICCGIDLAFENDKAYGDDTGKIVDNSIIVDKATKRLTEVKSINGEMVKTREDYASFIPHFESICEKHSSVKIYNVTEFGAYINGMEYSHLSKLIPVNDKFEVDNILEKIVPEKIYYAPTINEEYEKAKEIVVGLISGQKDVNEIMTKLQKSLFLYEFCQLSIIDYLKTEGDENSKSEFKNSIFTAWAKIEKAMDNYCTV